MVRFSSCAETIIATAPTSGARRDSPVLSKRKGGSRRCVDSRRGITWSGPVETHRLPTEKTQGSGVLTPQTSLRRVFHPTPGFPRDIERSRRTTSVRGDGSTKAVRPTRGDPSLALSSVEDDPGPRGVWAAGTGSFWGPTADGESDDRIVLRSSGTLCQGWTLNVDDGFGS